MAYNNNFAHVYLTRRNLLTLLSRLDQVGTEFARTEFARTITKYDTTHKTYPCSHITQITAVEDSDYYTERAPGPPHPED